MTGVPGTGKTTIARAIAVAYPTARVVHLQDLAKARGLLREHDAARDTAVVDMDELAEALAASGPFDVVEGHYAHEMDVDAIVLLRCDPLVLAQRLRERGWRDAKVRENVEAEALDVLAQEVLDSGIPAVELDVTALGVDEAARQVWAIAEGGPKALKGTTVGTAAWSLEALPWY